MGNVNSKILKFLGIRSEADSIKKSYSYLSLKSFDDESSVESDGNQWNLFKVGSTKIYLSDDIANFDSFEWDYSCSSISLKESRRGESIESIKWRRTASGHWTRAASSSFESSVPRRFDSIISDFHSSRSDNLDEDVRNIPLRYSESDSLSNTDYEYEDVGDHTKSKTFSENHDVDQKLRRDNYLGNTQNCKNKFLSQIHNGSQKQEPLPLGDKESLVTLRPEASLTNLKQVQKCFSRAQEKRDSDSEISKVRASKRIESETKTIAKSHLNAPRPEFTKTQISSVSKTRQKNSVGRNKKIYRKRRYKRYPKSVLTDESSPSPIRKKGERISKPRKQLPSVDQSENLKLYELTQS
ncbi:uncharacterized protein LOC111635628 [Centruroides sculpturatus]|uniref:uncharacterized protein LOC111635628 n=1 Tax=Centruroides sculpturatus TaxID=218467 RepID=UPI000C6DC1A9|nr:uncharacterized protein LOC111635628 [Centruroides sculpturatus]